MIPFRFLSWTNSWAFRSLVYLGRKDIKTVSFSGEKCLKIITQFSAWHRDFLSFFHVKSWEKKNPCFKPVAIERLPAFWKWKKYARQTKLWNSLILFLFFSFFFSRYTNFELSCILGVLLDLILVYSALEIWAYLFICIVFSLIASWLKLI